MDTDYTVIGGESFLKSVSAHCSHPVNSTPRLEVPRGSEGPLTNEPMFVSAVMLARVLYPTSTYPKSQKRDYTVRHTFGTRSVLHAPAIRLFVIRAIGAFVCLCRPVVERACVLHSAQHVFCRISVSLVVQDATPAVVAALLGAGMARIEDVEAARTDAGYIGSPYDWLVSLLPRAGPGEPDFGSLPIFKVAVSVGQVRDKVGSSSRIFSRLPALQL